MTESRTIAPDWVPTFTVDYADAGYLPLADETVVPDPIELPDDDINPDEADPLPDEEPVKTDPVPEEPA